MLRQPEVAGDRFDPAESAEPEIPYHPHQEVAARARIAFQVRQKRGVLAKRTYGILPGAG
jgi:hypothetical protein